MGEREQQSKIKNFTSIGLGIEQLFPQQDVVSSVLFLENLRPDPTKDENPFLLVKINPDGSSEVFKTGKKKAKTVKGVIVWVNGQNLGFLDSAMEETVGRLSINTPVWILEQTASKLTEEEKRQRVQKLAEWELVERKVVQKTGVNFDYCWYGRREKPARHNREYDLTLDWRFNNLLREMKVGYLRDGWVEIDCQEIADHCRKSKMLFLEGINPLLECLILGFGVRIKAPCGCWWHICMNGEQERDYAHRCGDEDCDGCPKTTKEEKVLYQSKQEQPRPFGKEILIGYNIPSSAIGKKMTCKNEGCGAELEFDRVLRGPNEISSDLKCPHCGMDGRRSITIKVAKGMTVRKYIKSKAA